jgi:aryl-alcohol dehydrogenase-like predicted oxidoreductase
VENSLRRLNTDYIDLYFAHWPDPETPVAETLRLFTRCSRRENSRDGGF